jgi:hypothetical protein
LYDAKFDLDIQSSFERYIYKGSIIKLILQKMFRLADNYGKIYEKEDKPSDTLSKVDKKGH